MLLSIILALIHQEPDAFTLVFFLRKESRSSGIGLDKNWFDFDLYLIRIFCLARVRFI